MKVLSITTALLAAMFFAGIVTSSAVADLEGGSDGIKGFVDENGDGVNDNAPDADGDGIPNGKDPDYVPPKDGTGSKFGNSMKQARALRRGFVDEDGDGINDLAVDSDGDGIPNCQDPDYVPADKGASKARTRSFRNTRNLEALGSADQIRDRDRDGSCDGTARKIRRR